MSTPSTLTEPTTVTGPTEEDVDQFAGVAVELDTFLDAAGTSPEASVSAATVRDFLTKLTQAHTEAIAAYTEPETCDMRHEAPYDFAWCLIHDTTFALGDACKFNGRYMWDVYADEADIQRGRAVVAEMKLEHLQDELAAVRAELEALNATTFTHSDADAHA